MQDEPKTEQDEAEVEAHHRPKVTAPSEDPSGRIGRSGEDEAEVEAHGRPRVPAPSEGRIG